MTSPQTKGTTSLLSFGDALVQDRFEAITTTHDRPSAAFTGRYHVLMLHWRAAAKTDWARDFSDECDISETIWRLGAQVSLPPRPVDLVVLHFPVEGVLESSACLVIKRQMPDTPIVVVAGGDSVVDRVVALESGADDFVSRPLHTRELRARFRAVLKHRIIRNIAVGGIVRYGDLQLNLVDHVASTSQKNTKLTRIEFHCLRALIEAGGQPVLRDVLVRRSGLGASQNAGKSRAVDVTVGRIRKKIDMPGWSSHIFTIRGQGYRL